MLTPSTRQCRYVSLMTKPRSYYVDPHHARYYHITSRCVRRAFLMGRDSYTGKDYSHRKQVFLDRLQKLSRCFSVSVMGYAVMSNHFHLVVRFDPNESASWSDEEVARRWCATFHGGRIDDLTVPENLKDFGLYQSLKYHELLLSPITIAKCRAALSCLSRFMQHLKQPFAVWANREDGVKGHFFESRFYSGVLLDRSDLLSCMAYVDLNPVEAGIARSLSEAKDTGIHERLYDEKFDPDKLRAYLAPLWTSDVEESEDEIQIRCTLRDYAEQLNLAIVYLSHPKAEYPINRFTGWMARLLNRERRSRNQQTAFYDYA